MLQSFKIFKYHFKNVPILTPWIVEEIFHSAQAGEIYTSLDMGFSKEKVYVGKDYVIIRNSKIDIEEFKRVLEEEAVYAILDDSLVKIAKTCGEHYYKLKPVAPNTAPTIEINGVHMHRISNITPWEDSKIKVKLLSIRRGCRVLDTCTGLGYTAIWALKMGAGEVLSVEKDVNVLEIACFNPWSRWLEDNRITIIVEDSLKVVKHLVDESFDRIMHDPPRLSLAGELYGLEFYRELYRVLKPKGILVHYTGQPGHKSGKNIMAGVKNRLEKAGFTVKKAPEALAVIAYKID
ncbi:RsmD family RNA methyltransferase [Candidatus Bathyarchaeota archaeon]|nr:RsmD family RNA methyltransferase [Candidatus Bathyarchaeota archaeon]